MYMYIGLNVRLYDATTVLLMKATLMQKLVAIMSNIIAGDTTDKIVFVKTGTGMERDRLIL